MKKIVYFGFLLMSAGLIPQGESLKKFDRPLSGFNYMILHRGDIMRGLGLSLGTISFAHFLAMYPSIGLNSVIGLTGAMALFKIANVADETNRIIASNWNTPDANVADETNRIIASNWNNPKKFTLPEDEKKVAEITRNQEFSRTIDLFIKGDDAIGNICAEGVKNRYAADASRAVNFFVKSIN